jgi:glycosyltransferase involved in cell wall biosynthesis
VVGLTSGGRRILHVLWRMEGGRAPVYQHVREQRRRGIEADVLVGSRGGFYGERTREAGAQVHELHQRNALDPTVARRAAAVLEQYGIAHFHGPEPLLMAFAARQPDLELFYTHRGGSRDYGLPKRVRHRIVGHYLRRRFDGVSANTQQSARAAAHLFQLSLDSIPVVYNGLDFALLEPRRARDEVLAELGDEREGIVRVGTASILRPLKRVDLLLRAIAAMRDEPVHCYVFGNGPARAELEGLAAKLGADARISFTGHKVHMGDYLQVLDAFVLPSGPQEAFGNAVVEAMGVGIPSVVFADGGGLTEHIEDGMTGFVVPNQGALERRLRELVHDPALRRCLGDAGRRAVRVRYSLDAMIEGYEAVYRSATR